MDGDGGKWDYVILGLLKTEIRKADPPASNFGAARSCPVK
jgi:hypothetical protein